MSDHLKTARRVLRIERDALDALAESLGAEFEAVVERLRSLGGGGGQVVLSGVGKSGHVARKIAATLASTGTRATYVHPTEASHGDMGMIAPASESSSGDAVIALSRSGETGELADLIAYCGRYRIPLIGMTAKADSALGRASDHVLLLPDVAEACATTRAPTTSTTLQIALGDALAVALLEAKGFTASDFRDYHPGGRLGAQLLTLERVMHTDMPLVEAGTELERALEVMSRSGFGCVGVTDGERLVGIVTDGDLRRALGRNEQMVGLDAAVDRLMTREPKVGAPGELASSALSRMTSDDPRVMQLFVVNEGAPVGLVHLHDLLRAGVA